MDAEAANHGGRDRRNRAGSRPSGSPRFLPSRPASPNASLQSANRDLAAASQRGSDANRDPPLYNASRAGPRFDLSLEAIKMFHGGVSEDLLLKEKQFWKACAPNCSAPRPASINASKTCSRDQADRRSAQRRHGPGVLHDIGELTAKIGSQAEAAVDARSAAGLELRLALAEEADADATTENCRRGRA